MRLLKLATVVLCVSPLALVSGSAIAATASQLPGWRRRAFVQRRRFHSQLAAREAFCEAHAQIYVRSSIDAHRSVVEAPVG